jgi:hypothetical protein
LGSWGALIMGFFGAFFVSLTLALQCGWTGIAVGLPFLVFAALALVAIATIRRPGTGLLPTERQSRITMWSSIAEGVGLFVAANLVTNLGHRELLLPAMALVVGLHFLPMGFGFPYRPYSVLGLALLAAAALGFTLTAPLGGAVAGFAAGAALLGAAAMAVRRDMRAKAAGA